MRRAVVASTPRSLTAARSSKARAPRTGAIVLTRKNRDRTAGLQPAVIWDHGPRSPGVADRHVHRCGHADGEGVDARAALDLDCRSMMAAGEASALGSRTLSATRRPASACRRSGS